MLFVWLGVVVVIIVVSVIVFLIRVKATKGANGKYEQKLRDMGFNPDISFTPGIFCIFVDEGKGLWSLKDKNGMEPVIYRFSDLAAFDIYEYGIHSGSVYSGMEDVGILRFGYVNQGHKQAKDYRLEIKFRNSPPVVMKFIGGAIDRNSELYSGVVDNANEFLRILTEILKKSDAESTPLASAVKQETVSIPIPAPPAVAVESISAGEGEKIENESKAGNAELQPEKAQETPADTAQPQQVKQPEQQEDKKEDTAEAENTKEETAEARICSNCGALVTGGNKFCSVCGVPVSEQKKEPQVCPQCGRPYKEGHVFCGGCGYTLPPVQIPQVNEQQPMPKPEPLCPRCGADIKEGFAFCELCGYDLRTAPPLLPVLQKKKMSPGRIAAIIIPCSVVLLAAAVLAALWGFGYFSKNDKDNEEGFAVPDPAEEAREEETDNETAAEPVEEEVSGPKHIIADGFLEIGIKMTLEAQGESFGEILTKEDLEKLTELKLAVPDIQDIYSYEDHQPIEGIIKSLTGLEYAVNLKVLSLPQNEITDISQLKDLDKLEKIILRGNDISNISALENKENLVELELDENRIEDITIVASLTNLTALSLGSNFSDISPLVGLEKLTFLGLSGEAISGDVSAIGDMTTLEWLALTETGITDFEFLENLKNLQGLFLRDSYPENLTALLSLDELFIVSVNEEVYEANMEVFEELESRGVDVIYY